MEAEPEEPAPEDPAPTRAEVLANAVRVAEEARRQIDHQVTAPDLIDTKAQATFTLIAVAATVLGSRTHITTNFQGSIGLLLFASAFGVAFSAWRAMQPRGGVS